MSPGNFEEMRTGFGQCLQWTQLISLKEERREYYSKLLPLGRVAQSGLVLSGPNSAGKTTQLEILAKRNFDVVPEFLRDSYRLSNGFFNDTRIGKLLSDMIVDVAACRHYQLIREASTDPSRPLIFDRGVGDYIGILEFILLIVGEKEPQSSDTLSLLKESRQAFIASGLDLVELRQTCEMQVETFLEWGRVVRYKDIAWLRPLPTYENDDVRMGNLKLNDLLDTLIFNAWIRLGYTPHVIPAFFNEQEKRGDYIASLLDF